MFRTTLLRAILALLVGLAASATLSTTSRAQSIGYPTVAMAFADLTSRRDVSVSAQGGFVVISEPATFVLWSFTQPGHPAHPTAVRRQVVPCGGGAMCVAMAILCEAAQSACDQLAREFDDLNEQMRHAIERGR